MKKTLLCCTITLICLLFLYKRTAQEFKTFTSETTNLINQNNKTSETINGTLMGGNQAVDIDIKRQQKEKHQTTKQRQRSGYITIPKEKIARTTSGTINYYIKENTIVRTSFFYISNEFLQELSQNKQGQEQQTNFILSGEQYILKSDFDIEGQKTITIQLSSKKKKHQTKRKGEVIIPLPPQDHFKNQQPLTLAIKAKQKHVQKRKTP